MKHSKSKIFEFTFKMGFDFQLYKFEELGDIDS